MRVAACLAVEAGIQICAPIRDGFLFKSPVETFDRRVAAYSKASTSGKDAVLALDKFLKILTLKILAHT